MIALTTVQFSDFFEFSLPLGSSSMMIFARRRVRKDGLRLANCRDEFSRNLQKA